MVQGSFSKSKYNITRGTKLHHVENVDHHCDSACVDETQQSHNVSAVTQCKCSHTVYPGAMASRKQRLRKTEADLVKKLDYTIQEVRDKQNLYLDAAFYNSIRSITASFH